MASIRVLHNLSRVIKENLRFGSGVIGACVIFVRFLKINELLRQATERSGRDRSWMLQIKECGVVSIVAGERVRDLKISIFVE